MGYQSTWDAKEMVRKIDKMRNPWNAEYVRRGKLKLWNTENAEYIRKKINETEDKWCKEQNWEMPTKKKSDGAEMHFLTGKI